MTTDGAPPPDPPLLIVAKGALGQAGGLVAGLIAGSVVCFLLDFVTVRGQPGYAFVIWVPVAAIASFLALSAAGEWAAKPPPGKPSWIYRADALRVGAWLVLGGMIATGAFYGLCAQLGWSYRDDAFWVPGSRPHTIAFCIGAVIGMACSWWMAKLEQNPAKG